MVSRPQTCAPAVPSRLESIAACDGVRLCVEHFDPAPARHPRPVILFAHGFGQSRHAWTETAAALAAEGYHCVTTDSRGHGESGWSPGRAYRFEQFLGDVATLAAHFGPRPVWVGASMGGLLGMVAAGELALSFAALVLVDVTPRWEVAGVERILAFMRAHPDGYASVEAAAHAVRAYLPHRASAGSDQRLKKYLVPTSGGRLRWHWDPGLLETVARDAAQWQDRLAIAAKQLDLPVLLVSGGKSDVVSEHTIEEFLTLAPHAEHVRVADATHAVVGDANTLFTAAVADFLARRVAHERRDSTAAAGRTPHPSMPELAP